MYCRLLSWMQFKSWMVTNLVLQLYFSLQEARYIAKTLSLLVDVSWTRPAPVRRLLQWCALIMGMLKTELARGHVTPMWVCLTHLDDRYWIGLNRQCNEVLAFPMTRRPAIWVAHVFYDWCPSWHRCYTISKFIGSPAVNPVAYIS